MTNTRTFSGTREQGKEKSIASELRRIERETNVKLDSKERFKIMMRLKLEQHQNNSQKTSYGQPRSAKAQQAVKDLAKRKEEKERRRLSMMVTVKQQNLSNGVISRNGRITDIAGNQIATINKKNGKISTNGGMGLGRYNPKKPFQMSSKISSAINQYSPYFINLRKMQALQAAGIDPRTGLPLNQETMNVHGNSGAQAAMLGGDYIPPSARGNANAGAGEQTSFEAGYGESSTGPRQNVGGTAWGAVSDNAWGVFSDNVWGTSSDTVWGTNQSDVWGGVGGSLFGSAGKKVQVWGTGSGKNYMLVVTNAIRKLFGITSNQTAKAVQSYRQSRPGASTQTSMGSGRGGGQSGNSLSGARTGGGDRSAPTTTRRGK